MINNQEARLIELMIYAECALSDLVHYCVHNEESLRKTQNGKLFDLVMDCDMTSMITVLDILTLRETEYKNKITEKSK